MKNKYEINNIVRIGNRDKRESYVYAILIRMSPHIYNKKEHGCIKIEVMESLLEFANRIISNFKWAGLIEESRKRKVLKGDGYNLPEAWEIVLRKIKLLETMTEDD